MLTILIADRTRPSVRWDIRRGVGAALGVGFAKWVASPARGRYCVCVPQDRPIEEMFQSADSRAELARIIGERVVLEMQRVGGPVDIRFDACLSEEDLAQLQGLVDQLKDCMTPRSDTQS